MADVVIAPAFLLLEFIPQKSDIDIIEFYRM